jgi:NAD(P)-dependent dehydrogenase (short-subunit alcohol dehydrogenase family)
MTEKSKPVALITDVGTSAGSLVAKQFIAKGWLVIGIIGSGQRSRVRSKALDVQPAEMTRSGDLERVIHSVVKRYRRIDVVVFNGGYSLVGPIDGLTYSQMREQLSVNVLAVAEITRLLVPVMARQGDGTIVSVANLFDRVALPGYSLYSASKYATQGLFESLHHELARFGIRVKIVDPGRISQVNQLKLVKGTARKWSDRELGPRFGLMNLPPGRTEQEAKEAVRIYRVATDKKRRLRYGPNRQRWASFCKKVLPERLYHRLIERTMI